jgi:hypothetical protein
MVLVWIGDEAFGVPVWIEQLTVAGGGVGDAEKERDGRSKRCPMFHIAIRLFLRYS